MWYNWIFKNGRGGSTNVKAVSKTSTTGLMGEGANICVMCRIMWGMGYSQRANTGKVKYEVGEYPS